MRLVTYGGRSFRTLDDVGDALFDFVSGLRTGDGQSVELPVVTDAGVAHRLKIWVRPNTVILCEAEDSVLGQEESRSAAQFLRDRVAALRTAATPLGDNWSLPDVDGLDFIARA